MDGKKPLIFHRHFRFGALVPKEVMIPTHPNGFHRFTSLRLIVVSRWTGASSIEMKGED